MSALRLEQRIEVLEEEVAELKRQISLPSVPPKPWWERIAGTFAADPAFEEAVRLGRKYRQAQRPRLVQRRKD